MESESVSPPKAQRNVLQPITLNEISNVHRNRKSISKKLQIEQENLDPQSFSFHFRAKKRSSQPIPFDPLVASIATLSVNQKEISSLPYEVHFEILKFLSPDDLLRNVQFINKNWYKLSNDVRLWAILEQHQKLPVDIKYMKKNCMVERRSRGKVYRAVSRVTGKATLIRMINLAVANGGCDDGIPASTLREISYLRNLDHPNISNIVEVEVKKEVVQLCSDYLDYNLREYMKLYVTVNKNDRNRHLSVKNFFSTSISEYKMPLRSIKLISYQILKGLSYLHHQGIIHRNLKGDNILVAENGMSVKIHDFALSRLATIPHFPYTPEDPKDRERSGREARRLWYRAPELLLRKKRYSFETDIWAFGCLLAEIATNETLFNGETEIEQLFKMFNLIGSPNASSLQTLCDDDQYKLMFPTWESVYFPYICYSKESDGYKQLYKTLMPNREKSFKKLLSLSEVLGETGLDLLWNCLSLNPQLRSSASTLLNHRFFDDIRQEFEPRYSQISECSNELCNQSGFYAMPNTPDCHIASFMRMISNSEAKMRPNPKYLEIQPALTEHMRCILIDWLIDVSMHFEFLDETLHLAIYYIDKTLSHMNLDKAKLQLVGVTCLKISDVFHERSKEYYKQENAKEYTYITADEYTPYQLVEMEKEILNLLDFKLIAPNSMHFVKSYIHLLQIPEEVAIRAMFLADLMLLSYHILEFDYSLIASAALFLACTSTNYCIDKEILAENKEFLNVHQREDLRKCAAMVKDFWYNITMTTSYANFDAVFSKYQTKHHFCGKSINIPPYTPEDIQNWFYSK